MVTLVGITRIHSIDKHIGDLIQWENSRTQLLASLLDLNDRRQQTIYTLFAARSAAEREAGYRSYQALGAEILTTRGAA